MQYQQSLEIEQRFEAILDLIREGKYSTPELAAEVGVSIPTMSRCILALRERGHEIQSIRDNNTWRYVLVSQNGSKKEWETKRITKRKRG